MNDRSDTEAESMPEAHRELKDPRILAALSDAATMQRFEILRRQRRPLSVAELADEARASIDEVSRSLDRLVDARLVEVVKPSRGPRKLGYRAAMRRLFIRWDRNDAESAAAWRQFSRSVREASRRVIDEAADRPGAERRMERDCGAAISVLLSERDAARVREALTSLYAMLSEADRRARTEADAGAHAGRYEPYHLAFDLQRLPKAELPAAEYFVIESRILADETRALSPDADRILSPREREVAMLLGEGLSRPSIAARLGLSAHTIVSISKSIYRKLGVRSRAELATRLRLA